MFKYRVHSEVSDTILMVSFMQFFLYLHDVKSCKRPIVPDQLRQTKRIYIIIYLKADRIGSLFNNWQVRHSISFMFS